MGQKAGVYWLPKESPWPKAPPWPKPKTGWPKAGKLKPWLPIIG
jgi:hypothetical protein